MRKKLKVKRAVESRMSKECEDSEERKQIGEQRLLGLRIVRNKIFQRLVSFVINIKTL